MTRQKRRGRCAHGLQMGVMALAMLTLLGGCASRDIPVDTAVMPYFPQRGRSLTFDARDTTVATAGPRWYDNRSDHRPEVFAGYDSPKQSVVVTREWQRLRVYNGRVRDEGYTRTYRQSVQRSSR